MNKQQFENYWGKPLTHNQFVQAALQAQSIDFDNAFGCQCVDLARFYIEFVLCHKQPVARPGARDWFNEDMGSDWILFPNTPTFVPEQGDLVIYERSAANGMNGHIGIVHQPNGVVDFAILEQNWVPGKVGIRTEHNWKQIVGFIRLKK